MRTHPARSATMVSAVFVALLLGSRPLGAQTLDGGCGEHGARSPIAPLAAAVSQARTSGDVCNLAIDPHLLSAYYSGRPFSHQHFIDLIAPMALMSQEKTGVPASVTIAQAILESGWGKTAHNMHNNLFGIKGAGDAGRIHVKTHEYYDGRWYTVNETFAAYTSLSASIEAHDQLLSTSSYYGSAMADRGNPYGFAQQLQIDGYATDPGYAHKLSMIIKKYNLYMYDARQCSAPGS